MKLPHLLNEIVYSHGTCFILKLIHCHLVSDFTFSPQCLADTLPQLIRHDSTFLLKKHRATMAEVSGIALFQFI